MVLHQPQFTFRQGKEANGITITPQNLYKYWRLYGCDFKGDFSNSDFSHTYIERCDLTKTSGLETARFTDARIETSSFPKIEIEDAADISCCTFGVQNSAYEHNLENYPRLS